MVRALATVLLVAAVTTAVIDWRAVASGRPLLERWAKPAVPACLLAFVGVRSFSAPGPGGAMAIGLAIAVLAGLVGDVLLLPQLDRFLSGLAAFLLGHLAYAAALPRLGLDGDALLWGAAVAAALSVGVGLPILAAIGRADPLLAVAVTAYLLAIGAMLTLGVGTGRPAVIAGALAFAASDAVLGWARFLRPAGGLRGARRLLVMVPYHLGQGLLVLGALGLPT